MMASSLMRSARFAPRVALARPQGFAGMKAVARPFHAGAVMRKPELPGPAGTTHTSNVPFPLPPASFPFLPPSFCLRRSGCMYAAACARASLQVVCVRGGRFGWLCRADAMLSMALPPRLLETSCPPPPPRAPSPSPVVRWVWLASAGGSEVACVLRRHVALAVRNSASECCDPQRCRTCDKDDRGRCWFVRFPV